MAAYAIGSLTVHDTSWQQEYGARMPALLQRHGGTLLARSAAQVLEGQSRLPGTVVMIEFPTMAAAQAWYDDPAHAPLKRRRQSGADFDMVLVAGV
jgi:uncharacterized protein (DUF1330 family)